MSGPPAGPAQPAPGGRAACLELAAHIRALQAELAGADAGSNEQRSFAEDLAAALLENHQRGCAPAQSGVSDVDTAIGYADQLLSGEPHGSRSRARFIAAVARYNRFLESENPADLDIAIWHASAIAAAEDPPAEAVALRGGALSLLGDALALRYRMAPDGAPTQLPDLSAAIAVLALLRRRLADDDPAKVFCVEDLATLHYDRHLLRANGDDADLSGAIDCLRWLRSAPSPDDWLLAEVTTRLGMALAERAMQRGNAAADVDEAIAALAAAGRLLPAADDRRPAADLHRGVLLGVRFTMHDGEPGDRAVAIATLRDVLAQADLDQEQADLARIWLSQLLLLYFLPGRAVIGLSSAGFDWAMAMRAMQSARPTRPARKRKRR